MSLAPRGTYAAYQRHKKAYETPCDACRAANTAYEREMRARHPESRETARRRRATLRRALIVLRSRHWTEYDTILAAIEAEA